jgi:hypothetical protein
MAVLGRILQAIGWVWLALGFLGPLVNLPVDLGIIPGIILIFISRIFRSQAARRASQGSEPPVSVEEQVEPRVLNTERKRPEPAPSQPSRPAPETRPTYEPVRSGSPKPTPAAKRQEMLEQILVAGTEMASESEEPRTTIPEREEPPPIARPMSSAEMIARAHERWNKRP